MDLCAIEYGGFFSLCVNEFHYRMRAEIETPNLLSQVFDSKGFVRTVPTQPQVLSPLKPLGMIVTEIEGTYFNPLVQYLPLYLCKIQGTPNSIPVIPLASRRDIRELLIVAEKFNTDRLPCTEKTISTFPFTLNGIWSWWQFSFWFWTQIEFHLVQKIKRKTVTTIRSHSMWKEMET